MATASNSRVLRTIPLLIATCHCERSAAIKTRLFVATAVFLLTLVAFPVYAKYSGGSGTAEDPYQIATAEDLMLLGDSPEDYDKHFKLMADIDLSAFSHDGALIGPDANPATKWGFEGTRFSGLFDGNGHMVSHLTVMGDSFLGLFGWLGSGAEVKDLGVVDVNITGLGHYAGGLAGRSSGVVTLLLQQRCRYRRRERRRPRGRQWWRDHHQLQHRQGDRK